MSIPPLLRCYYAGYDPQADTSCLLLEDLSPTHFQSEYPLPPPVSLCTQSVEALAEIHARFWEHPSLEGDFRPALPPGRAWNDRVTLAIKKLPALLDFIGDRLAPHHRTLYEHLLSCSSAPWMNLPGSPNQTLLHGDLHFWNLLFPIHGYNEHLRIFDWNMWDIGRPTGDLAYLLALHWSPERRARLESPLLNDYHRRLNACGIENYSMDTFLLDYRISVIQTLFIPIWQWNKGISPTIWWSHLERGLQAFEGLECAELI